MKKVVKTEEDEKTYTTSSEHKGMMKGRVEQERNGRREEKNKKAIFPVQTPREERKRCEIGRMMVMMRKRRGGEKEM